MSDTPTARVTDVTHVCEEPWDSEQKRCYLPFAVSWECPHCGEGQVEDFTDNYLSYPVFQGTEVVDLYCPDCEGASECRLVFGLTCEVIE